VFLVQEFKVTQGSTPAHFVNVRKTGPCLVLRTIGLQNSGVTKTKMFYAPGDQIMRAVVQRVSEASVVVDNETVGSIKAGFLVLLGVGDDDGQDDVIWLAGKVAGLRVFEDAEGKMNLDLKETGAAALVVSQFTLFGDCRKGRRPSFVSAARPEKADSLYQSFVAELKGLGIPVETGRFQTQMKVQLTNDGPVTLLLDSRKTF